MSAAGFRAAGIVSSAVRRSSGAELTAIEIDHQHELILANALAAMSIEPPRTSMSTW